MEKAIKKAIEGGYKLDYKKGFSDEIYYLRGYGHSNVGLFNPEGDISYLYETIYSDVNFWESLGRILRWRSIEWEILPNIGVLPVHNIGTPIHCVIKSKLTKGWQYQWHRFIDHLAEGKDIDSFFNNLLT